MSSNPGPAIPAVAGIIEGPLSPSELWAAVAMRLMSQQPWCVLCSGYGFSTDPPYARCPRSNEVGHGRPVGPGMWGGERRTS